MGILDRLQASNNIVDSGDLDRMLRAGNLTTSGTAVSPRSAMGVSAVWAAIMLLANCVAQIPIVLYRRDGGNKHRVRPNEHAVARLLKRPNTFQSPFAFRQFIQASRGAHGRAYVFVNHVRGGVPHELIPLPADEVTKHRVGNSFVYRVESEILRGEFKPHQIIESNWLETIRDGMTWGIGPVQQVREAVGAAILAERHSGQMFGNQARPSGILRREGGAGKLNKEQREAISESWNEALGGNNRYGTAVLDGSWDWKPVTMSAVDTQLIEQRKFSVEEVARMYGVPASMIGSLDGAIKANIEQNSQNFVTYSLMSHLVPLEQSFTAALLSEREQDTFFMEFLVDSLVRADYKSRMEGHSLAIQSRILNPNEVRGIENRNSYEGGDEYKNPNIEPAKSSEPEPDDD